MKTTDVIVLGAGMVGVCSALALKRKGVKVTLIDSNEPGSETSFGNAGIITPSSLIPFNNPKLFKSLPGFLANKSNGFRYSISYALSEMMTLMHFVSQSKQQSTQRRTSHLYQLIERSSVLHLAQSNAANCQEQLRPSGWLKLYRHEQSWQNAQYEQSIYRDYNIQTELMDAAQIAAFEPNLKAVYQRGMHITQALSVASPGGLVKSYSEHYLELGGEFVRCLINKICKVGEYWQLTNSTGEAFQCKQLVMATGPWSKALLATLDVKLPMIFERGGHREYSVAAGSALQVPIHDVDGSFVATPIKDGIRISCGVELNHQLAEHSDTQLDIVETNARQSMDFADQSRSQWQGARPTLPDSMPVIGPSKLAGLWYNTGHQHIGFSTGPGSAEILANWMLGETLSEDQRAFDPQRFKL